MKRIITSLVLENEKCIKPFQFGIGKYIGDPINIVRILNDQGCSELNIFDRSTKINFELLKRISKMSLIPIAYGGKYKKLDEIREIFKIGYEKVIFSSDLINNTDLIRSTINEFGSSSVVIIINYKYIYNKPKYFINRGTKMIKISFEKIILLALSINPSEIILQNIDRESSFEGLDKSILSYYPKDSKLPLVISGGCNSKEEAIDVLKNTEVNGIAIGSLFCLFGKYKTPLVNHQFNLWNNNDIM